jgi:cytochrome P450
MCISSNFALIEAQLVLATIAQRYRLQMIPGYLVEPEALLSLRPHHGLPMTLHCR